MKSFILLAATVSTVTAQDFLDRLDDRLYLESQKIDFRTDLSVMADIEAYTIDGNPPGLLFSDDDVLIQPRLSLFLDTHLGQHFYSLVQFRVDRGFDPGSMPNGQARFDEYLLRYTPLSTPVVNLQIGKFATVYGNWVKRHDSWTNPFINAPVPYENVTIVSDISVPASNAAFLARKSKPDQKAIWLPIIWGPSYSSGASVFGTVESFDYAFEFKNASVSSRPSVWDPFDLQWENPTYTGRVGYRPNAAWNIGANASYGAYLIPGASASLGDFQQFTFGPDLNFTWRHLELWAEAMASRFEVPNVGNTDTVAYYLEARYKFTPTFYGALRWNQQFFDEIDDGAGGQQRWDQAMWRAETAVGYRFTRHLQMKVQYSYSHQKGPFQQGEQMAAAQLTLKF